MKQVQSFGTIQKYVKVKGMKTSFLVVPAWMLGTMGRPLVQSDLTASETLGVNLLKLYYSSL